MFKSLKEKLKGWISKGKEETQEVVETPQVVREEKKTKETPIPKAKEKKIVKEKELKKEEEKQTKTDQKPITQEKPKEKTKPKEEKSESKEKEEKIIQVKSKEEQTTKEELKKEVESEPKEKQKEESIQKTGKKEEEQPEEKKGFFKKLFGSKKEIANEKEEEEKQEEKSEPKEEESKAQQEEKKEVQIQKTEEIEEEPKEKKKTGFSLFKRKTLTEEKFEELFDELELILLQNNVAMEAIDNIKSSLKEKLVGESSTDIETALKSSIESILINPPNLIEQINQKQEKPFVILFAGINGAGKTTTIAKVTHLLKKHNLSVCLASADTFRAAAIEQLQVHADRLEVPLIKKDYGADPASVGFDAVKYAKKHAIDCVLIDTAGRMNNRDSLMKEIEKISRVNNPDLKIFLGESTTGNDATQQAKDFNDAIGIDGIILSKADVDEKGGTAISVAQVTNKPIYFLGMGQTYDDLEPFDKEKLLERLFG